MQNDGFDHLISPDTYEDYLSTNRSIHEDLNPPPPSHLYSSILHDEDFSPEAYQVQAIPSSPHRLPQKFHYHLPTKESEISLQPPKNDEETLKEKENLDRKIAIEVVLTEEKLKELMKCKPTEEWISKAGKSLKLSFPELAKAHEDELRLEQSDLKKTKVPSYFPLLSLSSPLSYL